MGATGFPGIDPKRGSILGVAPGAPKIDPKRGSILGVAPGAPIGSGLAQAGV